MLNLYIEGKLELFGNVFDINYFMKNKRKIIRWSLYQGYIRDVDMPEIVSILKARGEYRFTDYIYLFCKAQAKKVKSLIKTCIKGVAS